ncbi:hypothetical protein MBAV_001919 [Candidatus Magnetobacterium bavaricum]|uniref:Uncharacterized protein n=1 Tax=Candidatus Magnetobacterium bavaricum TaxID=29290 RepID=A0A0F3GVI1_9BACT|nr:hypothetical protein MBAV_001919 [Candidatus Magnetobacterium bavaricum]
MVAFEAAVAMASLAFDSFTIFSKAGFSTSISDRKAIMADSPVSNLSFRAPLLPSLMARWSLRAAKYS